MNKFFEMFNKLLGRGAAREVEDEDDGATVINLEAAENGEEESTSKQTPKKAKAVKKVKKAKTGEKKEKAKIPDKDDSVSQDIRKFKSFAKDVSENVEKVLGPQVKKGMRGVGKTLEGVKDKVSFNFDRGLIKKVVGFILIAILFVGLVVGALQFVGRTGINNNNVEQPQPVVQPTPTPQSYRPYKPSVYSEDEEMVKLEEDINVLEKEISRTNIRENTLNPPQLDFDIKF